VKKLIKPVEASFPVPAAPFRNQRQIANAWRISRYNMLHSHRFQTLPLPSATRNTCNAAPRDGASTYQKKAESDVWSSLSGGREDH